MTNKKIRKTVAKVMYDMTNTIFYAFPNYEELIEIWERINEIVTNETKIVKGEKVK